MVHYIFYNVLINLGKEEKIRLQKILSDCGIASRRKSEEMILNGIVKVNGIVANIGDKVNPLKDKITVNGKKLIAKDRNYYIMLYKPRGFITTMSDEFDRKCITQLVADIPARIYPVGRLDKDSEGLLLMTNDGEFANNIIHPSKHIKKTYRVTVSPNITDEQLAQFNIGMVIDGVRTAPADAFVISRHQKRVVLEIVLYEGRNRQIRKMCENLGLEVKRLKRIGIGPLKLGLLHPGKYRELTDEEVKKLSKKNQ